MNVEIRKENEFCNKRQKKHGNRRGEVFCK
jgi:hypothetical protein